MSVRWVYCPQPETEDGVLSIEGEEHAHLKVSRTRVGEAVEVFDGLGRVWEGEVVGSDRRATRIRLGKVRDRARPPFEIILAQALIKSARLAWIFEKSVEIGVTRIIPFRASRSNFRGDLSQSRWRRIIVEAAKQSQRHHLPRLDPVCDIDDLIAFPAATRILFDERSSGAGLEQAIDGCPVLYLVGPEGGWTAQERESARAGGMKTVHLGAGILRAETAALVGGALIGYELGVFRS